LDLRLVFPTEALEVVSADGGAIPYERALFWRRSGLNPPENHNLTVIFRVKDQVLPDELIKIWRRLRSYIWKQWKNRRTRAGNLMKRGISKETAVKTGCARKGAWRMSEVKWVMIALPNDYFTSRGLVIPST
jgi:hypothetical protein